MSAKATRVDDHGVHLHRNFDGSADVYFDEQRVWSFTARRLSADGLVPWPKVLKRLLDGQADVRVQSDHTVLFEEFVQFGQSSARLKFIDKNQTPIIVDKWGLIQRPFDGRREAGVVEAMTDMAEQILKVMREDCGIEGWISFGTLLGAARSGQAIGHDSDIDLCFLSASGTPAEMVGELWAIARALRAKGMRVQHKAGCFITVRFPVPDGGQGGIDVYTCFFLDGLLYETATVRAPVPVEAVLPLGLIEFEGRMLPAPADPEALLELSYGPNWRVPDPSFQHRPPLSTVRRFDQWFGSLMRHRREWRQHNNERASGTTRVSPFARWVTKRLDPGIRLVEVGSGSGRDLRYYTKSGFSPLGLDYAPPNKGRSAGQRRLPRRASFEPLNLYDLRDTLTLGAVLAREGTTAMCARELFETLEPDGLDNCVQMMGMALRGGGQALIEGRLHSQQGAAAWQATSGGGKLRSLEPVDLEHAFNAVGGRVTYREGFGGESSSLQPVRWRMIVEWPGASADAATTEGTVL